MCGNVIVSPHKIRIIVLRFAVERAVRFERDDGGAALRMLFVDAGVSKIVD